MMSGTRFSSRDGKTLLFRHRRVLVGGCCLALLLAMNFKSVSGQQAANGTAPKAITPESIQAIRKQAAEATDVDSDAKHKIESACVQTLGALKPNR